MANTNRLWGASEAPNPQNVPSAFPDGPLDTSIPSLRAPIERATNPKSLNYKKMIGTIG